MTSTREQIEDHLAPLLGRKLAVARRAAGMRALHFGSVTEDDHGSWGEYALHLSCEWRVELDERIVTGQGDLWEPANPDEEIDRKSWHYETHPNLQDQRMGELLGTRDARTRSWVNMSNRLVVERVDADNLGGLALGLSDGYRIVVFPSGSREEAWRMFMPGSESAHLVIEGGRVASPDRRLTSED